MADARYSRRDGPHVEAAVAAIHAASERSQSGVGTVAALVEAAWAMTGALEGEMTSEGVKAVEALLSGLQVLLAGAGGPVDLMQPVGTA